MQNETVCPFLIRELYEDNTAVGIKCQGAEIRFSSKHIRRNFVYPLCGSVGNYESCLMYKTLSKAAEKE